MISNKQKALIHLAKSRLGLSEAEYREILRAQGGAESSKFLDDLGAERVMRFFQTMGFEYEKPRRKRDFTILASAGQRKVLWHLAEDLQWIPKRLYGFILKMTGKEHVEQLTREEASKCIEGLKKMRGRSVSWQ